MPSTTCRSTFRAEPFTNRACCSGRPVAAMLRLILCLLVAGGCTSLWWSPPPAAAEDDTATFVEQGLTDLTPAELQVRYAERRLELAQLNLERAERVNRLVDRAVGPRESHRLANHVELTRRQLALAKEHPRTTARQTNLASAEVAVSNARADLETALRASARTTEVKLPAVTAINIDRLRTMLAMAEIRLEMVKRPDYVPSLIDEMQWHIDLLTNEVIDLRHQLEAGGNNTFGAERP